MHGEGNREVRADFTAGDQSPKHRQQPSAFPSVGTRRCQERLRARLTSLGEKVQNPLAIPTIGGPCLVLTKKRGVFQVRGADLALGDKSKDPALGAGVAPRRLKLGAIIVPMSAQVVSVFNLVKH